LYPEDTFKAGWDLYVAIILIFTCVVTPYRIALFQKDRPGWLYLGYFIDFSFFLDILIIFNSAFYNDDFELVQDRTIIACDYIKKWFTIDIFAIIPFDILFDNGLN
jgi:hypothetical protein